MSPVRVLLDPSTTLLAVVAIGGGISLGTVSGLTPGLHANNFALLLAAAATGIPGPPRLVAVAMLAAGVTHTFLDVVPALALGVPDADMAAIALPGHRLVLSGRGREALRLSAIGSATAVALAVPLALPVTALMRRLYPVITAHLTVVLLGIALLLVITERTWFARVGGVLSFAFATLLGWVTLDLDPTAPLDAGGILAPLFAGLFGAPILIDAMRGAGVPEQDDGAIAIPFREVGLTAGLGSAAGSLVAYLPGVSSAIAAVVALLALPNDADDRGFIVATSGINTSNSVFALFALVAFGTPRTGVMVGIEESGAPIDLPLLLVATVVTAAVASLLVVGIGDRYLVIVGRLDPFLLSATLLVGLAVVSWLFAGLLGIAVYVVATAIGRVPQTFGAKRVHLMAVLLGPIAFGI